MLSNNKLKQYQQLKSKKFRQKYGQFVVEGLKSINELLNSSWPVESIVCNSDFEVAQINTNSSTINVIENREFHKLSNLTNPSGVLAVAKFHEIAEVHSPFEIALDGINDPGNLGTIIRIADWYGIKKITCSTDTVDLYNPKTIQASMGSFLRVKVTYLDLKTYLKNKNVYATVLNGADFRTIQKPSQGVLLVGNEANGISQELLNQINHQPISIPRNGTTDSLNAAIATAVFVERLLY